MADNEYAIWRAIGSLTQRVRDLEQPTPAPEPPLCACGHSKREHEVFGVCQGSECDCMGYEKQPEPPKASTHGMCSCGHAGAFHHPGDGHCWICRCRQYDGTPSMPQHQEASQPATLPAEVDKAFKDAEGKLITGQSPYDKGVTAHTFTVLRSRLASHWPKAGQVPSVEEIGSQLEELTWSGPLETTVAARRLHKWLLSRTSQPSPVTAEKLARFLAKLNAFEYDALGVEIQSLYDGRARRLLQAFPTLGQGRLTREQIAKAVVKRVLIPTSATSAWATEIADDLLALQGPMTVSKEQWNKLFIQFSRADYDDAAGMVKAWLKAEFGAEVQER